MIPDDRLQELILSKDPEEAVNNEGWAVIDGAIVIYDVNCPPFWLEPVLDERDDDGNTQIFCEEQGLTWYRSGEEE